jgi:hypothetical protein
MTCINFLKTYIYVKAHRNMTLEICFMYLGNKETYGTSKTCCIISVLFATCFIILSFSIRQIVMFIVNDVLKFMYALL